METKRYLKAKLQEVLIENNELRNDLVKTKSEIQEALNENKKLKNDLVRTKALLASAKEAKEKGCLRGEYCRACKSGALITYPSIYSDIYNEKCICTYGTCKHFEKNEGAKVGEL